MILFGTKAETLERFKRLVKTSTVLDLYYFQVGDWKQSSEIIVETIMKVFEGRRLVVRSSALDEDGALASLAGAHESFLDVSSTDVEALRSAIDAVVESYDGNPGDQVLVQPMLDDVDSCGVIMTHDVTSGAPYYVLNYDDESGETDRITGGKGANKTIVIHRDHHTEHIDSPRVREMLAMTRELETICGGHKPLDIEFARTKDGALYLLQVRAIAVQKNWDRGIQDRIAYATAQIREFLAERSRPRPDLAGSRTILGQMPDWNPAEIIGTHPRPLAVSLYRDLITDRVWHEARTAMGYRALPADSSLMLVLAGQPYIDVRNSFNSFLPPGLPHDVEQRLVDAWLARLEAHPEFHDKVEFQVAQTVYDFSFDEAFDHRYAGVLEADEAADYAERLHALTVANLDPGEGGSLAQAIAATEELAALQAAPHFDDFEVPLWRARVLLDECRRLGTLPFSIIARHAFIAETLLRSAVARGALAASRLDAFKRSLETVAGELTRDFAAVHAGELAEDRFLARYGHLRPGTYDILSPRYDQRHGLFGEDAPPAADESEHAFTLTKSERAALAGLLEGARLDHVTPEELLAYAGQAIVHREHAKFVFTKHLSAVLEIVAHWGSELGLSRDDVSYLGLGELTAYLDSPVMGDTRAHLGEIVERRCASTELASHVALGYIMRGERDIYVVPLHRAAPNFVTTKAVRAEPVQLDGRTTAEVELGGKIVCIENADPGFDWIFTRGIAGLVSKFGGANSHMTIRCAELGLPAAIGVGEQTFERLVRADAVELSGAEKLVRPAHG